MITSNKDTFCHKLDLLIMHYEQFVDLLQLEEDIDWEAFHLVSQIMNFDMFFNLFKLKC